MLLVVPKRLGLRVSKRSASQHIDSVHKPDSRIALSEIDKRWMATSARTALFCDALPAIVHANTRSWILLFLDSEGHAVCEAHTDGIGGYAAALPASAAGSVEANARAKATRTSGALHQRAGEHRSGTGRPDPGKNATRAVPTLCTAGEIACLVQLQTLYKEEHDHRRHLWLQEAFQTTEKSPRSRHTRSVYSGKGWTGTPS